MKTSKKPAFFHNFAADPKRKMFLLFGVEGILLQFVSSVNNFGNNLYATNMGATDTQIGFIQTVPNLVAVALLLPAGILGDRMRSSKRLPMMLTLFMGVMYLFYGTVPALGPGRMGFFFVFLGLTAGVMAIYNAQWQNFFGDATYPSERNDIYTFRNRLMNLGGTIIPLICGAILTAMPDSDSKLIVLRVFYYTSAGFLFFQSWILSRIPSREKEEGEEESPKEKAPRFSLSDVGHAIAGAWNHKPFRRYFIVIIPFYIGWYIDWTNWYLMQVHHMGMNESHLSLFNAVQCVVFLLSIGFFARLNKRRSVYFSLPIVAFGLCLSCISVMLCMLFPMSMRPWAFIVLAGLPCILQSGISLCLVQMLLNAAPTKNRSLVISLFTMVTTLGNSLMPLLGVNIYNLLGSDERAMAMFFGIALIWRAFSGVLLIFYYRKLKKEGQLHIPAQSES